MALNQAGLVANQTGLSIEETTGALTAFAQAGLMGSDAGTSLKSMLQRLTPQSKAARDQFDELGISAYDANGQFIGLAEFSGQLRDAMRTLSPEARNAAMSVMFGSDAVRAATVLYNEGAQGIQGWIDAANDQGYAAETARLRLDNLKGDVEALGGALDTVFIQSGSGANDALREIVQGATAVVDVLGKMPASVHSGIGILVGSTGVAMLAASGISTLRKNVVETKAAFQALGMTAKTAGVAMGVAGIAITAATAGLAIWASKSAEAKRRTDELKGSLDEATGAATDNSRKAVAAALEVERGFGNSRWGHSAREDAEAMGMGIKTVTDAALGNADALKELEKQYEAHRQAVIHNDGELSEARTMWDNVRNFIEDHKNSLTDAQIELANSKAAVGELSGALGAASGALGSTKAAVDPLTDAWRENAEAAQAAFDATMDYINGAVSAERAAMSYEAALDKISESVKENGRTLDITTEKGRANRDALLDIVDAGQQKIEQAAKDGKSEEQLQKIMQRTRDDVIAAAMQFGKSEKAAEKYADKLGLIPEDVTTAITLEAFTDAADAQIRDFITRQQMKTINLRVQANPSYSPAHASAQVMRASGGSVFGPGTETSDSIPALLSNNEHVWSAKEVKGAGGHGALERMRSLARAGKLPAFAKGGAVARDDRVAQLLKQDKQDVEAAKAQVKQRRRAENAAQSSYNSIDGKKENQAAKKAAKRRLDDAKKATKAAEKELKEARDQVAARRKELDELRSFEQSLTIDVRRGELQSQGTSGLSGAYGLVDQVRSASTMSGLTNKQSKDMFASAVKAEKNFKALYAEADRLQKSLDKAEGNLADMRSISAGIKSNLSGGFSLTDSIQEEQWDRGGRTQKRGVTGAGMLSDAKAYQAKVKRLGARFKTLADWGASSEVLQEIAGYGLDDALLIAEKLTKSEVQELTGVFAGISSASGYVGNQATRNYTDSSGAFYANGVYEAKEEVLGLRADMKENNKEIKKQTNDLINALAKPFEVKYSKGQLTSIVKKKATGGPVIGPGTGTSDDIPALLSNGEHVWTAQEVQAAGGHGVVEGLRQLVKSGATPTQSRSIDIPINPRLATQVAVTTVVDIDYERLAAAVNEVLENRPAEQLVANLHMSGRPVAQMQAEINRQNKNWGA
jgi:hypothetical protein